MQLFYMINSVMELQLSTMTTNEVIYEYIYSISSVVFHSIEIYNIVFIADIIGKEVCILYLTE